MVDGVPFQEAIDFLKQKTNLPTRAWTDLQEGAHARSFVVAGAMKQQLLSDFHGALVKALKEGSTREQFQKAFDDIAARHGWSYKGGRRWRARVIYDTNMRMARAAGRWEQIQRAQAREAARGRKLYLRYVAVMDSRTRPEHKRWHGLIRPADDPIWSWLYPPNGWGCRCTVQQLTERDLKRYGYQVTPDDQVPPIEMEDRVVKTPDGKEVWPTPAGVDTGFGHNVGRSWLSGAAPRPLQEPLRPFGVQAPAPKSLPPLPPRPSKAKLLPDGLPEEEYVRRFLEVFKAAPGRPVGIRDAAGHALSIGEELFQVWPGGPLKTFKRGRHRHLLQLAEAILDPDEIWVDWALVKGVPVLRRRYLRRLQAKGSEGGVSVFEWSSAGWSGRTSFPADTAEYLENQRRGVLLWRRK